MNLYKDIINLSKMDIDTYSKIVSADVGELKDLLESGINPDVTNNDGDTPLHYTKLSEEKIKMLLEAGANPNIKNNNGITPLHYSNTVGKIKLLIEAGADPNTRNNIGVYPLHGAMLRPDKDSLVKLLLKNGANPNCTEDEGIYPIQWGYNENLLNFNASTDYYCHVYDNCTLFNIN